MFIEVTYKCSGEPMLIGVANITNIRVETGNVQITVTGQAFPSCFTITETYAQVKELLK